MIERIVIKYLRKKFPEEIVKAEVPPGMPERFITVEKVGSQQLGPGLFESTFAIQSWEMTRMKASELSERICEAMRNMADEVPDVSRCSGSDYDFTDTTTKRYRYQGTFTIIHY